MLQTRRAAQLLLLLAALFLPAQALHFYLEGTTPKCFYEDLPKDTIVAGNFRGSEFDTQTQSYSPSSTLQIFVSVDELEPGTSNPSHRIVSQLLQAEGKLTFTTHNAGEHKLCFQAHTQAPNPGWLSHGPTHHGVKLNLDIAVGGGSATKGAGAKGKEGGVPGEGDLVQRVRDLNVRLQDIRKEQMFQREREAEFRDQSESTNARVARWTFIQLVVLGGTCAWQLSHLRAFFIKQKLT